MESGLQLASLTSTNSTPKTSCLMSNLQKPLDFPRSGVTNRIENGEAAVIIDGSHQSAKKFHNELAQRRGYYLAGRNRGRSLPVSMSVVTSPLSQVQEEEEVEEEIKGEDIKQLSQSKKLSREAFVECSRTLLANPEDLLTAPNSSASRSKLLGALRTACARNLRLSEYRHNLITRNALLQQQVCNTNAELDVAVDVLRHEREKFETERLKSTVESRSLRQELAAALARLESLSIGASKSPPPGSLASRERVGESGGDSCQNCPRIALESSTLRITAEKLEADLARQRLASAKENALMRVQLADRQAEIRSLRIQLSSSRLRRNFCVEGQTDSEGCASTVRSPPGPVTTCSSCQRLQTLLDVLQSKQTKLQQALVPPVNQPDLVSECNTASSHQSSTKLNVGVQTDSPVDTSQQRGVEDDSLFYLLESGAIFSESTPRINDLTTQFLERQLGAPLEELGVCAAHSTTPTIPKPKSLPISPVISSPVDVDVPRLLERLRTIEAEVESSADQLKASNHEFMQLRERLTTATVEKAHLKESLDGLNDQVMALEKALYERTQQLRHCKEELSNRYAHPQSPTCVVQLQEHHSACGYPTGDFSTDVSTPPVKGLVIKDLPRIVHVETLCSTWPAFRDVRARCYRLAPYANLTRNFHLIFSWCAKNLTVAHQNRCGEKLRRVVDFCAGKVNRHLLTYKKPRLVILFTMLVYVSFLHILLINCLLQ